MVGRKRFPLLIKHITLMMLLAAVAEVTGRCKRSDDECDFYFEIEHKLTMMDKRDKVFPANGKLYKYDVTNVSSADPVSVDGVISADGWEDSRLVTVVNGTMPGPDMIVYEGQNITVYVKNKLESHSFTIHWHGLHQVGTPWMDGVPYVSQCPTGPGQTFKYQFTATPKGTFWWHSHVGAQRSNGVYGALIIREKKKTDVEEHIIQISDWNHNGDSDFTHAQAVYGMYEGRTKLPRAIALDGTGFTNFRTDAGLINGRGRYYDRETGQSNMAPLTVYEVRKKQKYRFRVIGVGVAYPFRISIDKHMLTVVASDGYDLEPVTAESFIINPGERIDFEITADRRKSNYWIRGITLEKGYYHRADAILRYVGAPEEEPTSSRQNCNKRNPCLVVNCPFTYYPERFTTCRTFGDMKSAVDNDPAPPYIKGKFQEYFLNFAIPGAVSVNGRVFETPDVDPLTQPTKWHSPCESPACGEDRICKCTQALVIGNGDTVQMIFTNMGSGRGGAHPVHMHGHSFYVVKVGYGTYDEATAELLDDNLDVDCRGNPDRELSFCNDATWSNSSWRRGNIPDMELQSPPRKDTIIVPPGSYTVVRIRANNPGLWNMHCHIEPHNIGGMRLLLNESFAEVPKAPEGFPACHSFPRRISPPTACDST